MADEMKTSAPAATSGGSSDAPQRPPSRDRDRDRGPRPGGGGGREGGRKYFRRKKVCKFCVEKIEAINYKDVRLLAGICCREREDRASPFNRGLHPSPAQVVERDQAGAEYRVAAVCGKSKLEKQQLAIGT